MNTEATATKPSTGASRKKQARGLERRRIILEATRTLLADVATNELSLYQIAGEAGIPPSSVYHFFPKVDTLLAALVENIFVDFDAIADQPIDESAIQHWHDIFAQLQTRYVAFYREHKYVRDLILGQHVVNSIRHADYEHDDNLGHKIHRYFQTYYKLPPLPETYNIFAIALQVADKVYSISHQENGNITDVMAQEGLKAGLAYLGRYLPQQMIRIDK